MKKSKIIIIALVAITAIVFLFVLSAGNQREESSQAETKSTINSQETTGPVQAAEKIEVIYFYSSARCPACVMAGEYVESTMKEFDSEKVSYLDVNVEDDTKKEIVNKYQARGSSLFIGVTRNGKETLEEEVNAWRYLGNEAAFKDYLTNKINNLLGT